MNLELVNLGLGPDTQTGDPLYIAFTKINSNSTLLQTMAVIFGGTLHITMVGGATSYLLNDSRIGPNSRLKLTAQSQGAASVGPQLWVPLPIAGSFTINYVNDGTSNNYPFTYEVTV